MSTLQLLSIEADRVSPIQVRQRSVLSASVNAPTRRLVIALYDFKHPSDDVYTMLPLSVGDIVAVVKQEGDWLEGELRDQRGYFPANFVGEAPVPVSPSGVMTSFTLAIEEFRLEHSRRSLAAIELVETERRYVGELQLLQYAVLAPLQRNACDFQFARKIRRKQDTFDLHSDLILKHEQIEHVFSNWEAICRLNSSFLTDLESCVKKWHLLSAHERVLGLVLLEYIPRFNLYGEYCANFGKSQVLLAKLQADNNSRFVQFQDSIKECGLMEKTLNSYLISPIQRVPRYQMLITELLKATPSGHPDQVLLQKALAAVIGTANDINESVRVKENHELVAKLEASFIYNPRFSAEPRQLRRHGELSKKKSAKTSDVQDPKPPVKRMFFLFDDMLAYAGVQPGTRKLLLRGKLPIDSSFEIVDRGELEVIVKAGKFFQIFFPGVDEKRCWLADIRTCISEQAAKRAHIGTHVVDECQSCKKKFGQSVKFTCKYCLGQVCKGCSKSTKRDENSKTTVCNTCFESHKPISATRAFFGLVRSRSRSSRTGSHAPQVPDATTTQEFFVLDCPLGHGLAPKIAVEEGYACDVCEEKNISLGEKMQSCAPCNYYVCLACQQKPGAILSASFGSAELTGMMLQSQKTFLERFADGVLESEAAESAKTSTPQVDVNEAVGTQIAPTEPETRPLSPGSPESTPEPLPVEPNPIGEPSVPDILVKEDQEKPLHLTPISTRPSRVSLLAAYFQSPASLSSESPSPIIVTPVISELSPEPAPCSIQSSLVPDLPTSPSPNSNATPNSSLELPFSSPQLSLPRRRAANRSYSFIATPSSTPPIVPPFPRSLDRTRHRSLIGTAFARAHPHPITSPGLFVQLDSVKEENIPTESKCLTIGIEHQANPDSNDGVVSPLPGSLPSPKLGPATESLSVSGVSLPSLVEPEPDLRIVNVPLTISPTLAQLDPAVLVVEPSAPLVIDPPTLTTSDNPPPSLSTSVQSQLSFSMQQAVSVAPTLSSSFVTDLFSSQLDTAINKLASLVRAQLSSEPVVTDAKLAQTIALVASQLAKEVSDATALLDGGPSKRRVPPPPRSTSHTPIQLHMTTSVSESTTSVAPMVISIRRPPPPPLVSTPTQSSRRPPPPPHG